MPEILGLSFSAMKLRAKTSVTTAMDFTIRSSIIHPLFLKNELYINYL
jgi:hypothetical protein